MGLVTLLRGFKVPVVVLDRFLAANGVDETNHTPPHFFEGATPPQLDPPTAFFRAKLATSIPDPASLEAVRLFIPYRCGHARSKYGYVSYAFVMVFGQRHVDLATELPEQAPPGFAELRREILGFATEGEQALLKVAGMQDPGGQSAFFAVLTEEREFPLERPFVRKSDLRCAQCAAEFETYSALYDHRCEVHGLDVMNLLPDDL